MGDLYNIPNDDGATYRLRKFVEYQHEVPSIHYRFLGEWIKRKHIDFDRAVNMCWYMSVTYNELTCLLLYKIYSSGRTDHFRIWIEYGDKILLGSARKHVRYNNRFETLMKEWDRATLRQPYLWLKRLEQTDAIKTLHNVETALKGIKECGRFAKDLFIETVSYLKGYLNFNIGEPADLDWDNCDNLTSGTYNIFYQDERANLYDKTKHVDKSEYPFLNYCLEEIQTEIQVTYPEQESRIYSFVGKICSFRNLFKGLRYGGFHHDRELGWLKQYEAEFPQYKALWGDCYKLRQAIFPAHLLGELNGWDGIRKKRKRLWLDKGLTGVEKYA